MNIDIRTFVIILGITHLIQVAVFYLQYRINREYQGIGWWLMWSVAEVAGFASILLRGVPSVNQIAIIMQNTSIFLGTVFIYLGMMSFFKRRINPKIVCSVSVVFIISIVFFTYVQDNLIIRSVIFNGSVAFTSLLTAYVLIFYRIPFVIKSARFNAVLFITHGAVFLYRTVIFLSGTPVEFFLKSSLFNDIPFIDALIVSLLWTYGFILMINQRLNGERNEDNENRKLIFNTSPDAVLITRVADGCFVEINDGFESLSGYIRAEVLGKTILEVDIWENPSDREIFVKSLRDRGLCENIEAVFRRKDGSLIFGLISARIINIQGIPHIISVTRDITDRKQTENLLNQTRQNYETFFNTIDEFLFVMDVNLNIIHANDTVTKRLGYTIDELAGKSVLVIHPAERRNEAGRIISQILSGSADFCPVPVATKTGVLIPVETRVSRGFWDGKPVLFGVTKDISDIRLSEEKFSRLFHINPSACSLSSLDDNRYIEVNEAFYALLGFDEHEVIGKTSVELRILSSEMIASVLQNADITGKVLNAEADLKAKNGDIKHVLLSAENINVQDKRYRFTVVHDITVRKQIEAELRESELKYRSLIENTSDVVFCVNEKGEYLFANKIYASTFGQTPDYFTGKTFWDIYPKEHADQRQAASIKVFETGEAQSLEVTVPLPDRSLYFLAKANPIKDESGKVIMNLTTATDITDRKKIEDELRSKSEELERYFTSSLDLLCITDIEGHFLRLNPEWENVLGYSIDELQGRIFLDLVHPDDLDGTLSVMSKLGAQEDVLSFENRYLGKDGLYRWIEWRSKPQGNLIYAAARDVTKRKNSEDALRSSEEELRNLFLNAPVGIFHSSLDGRLLSANPALAEMLGYRDSTEVITDITDMRTQIYADLEMRQKIINAMKQTDGWVHFDRVMWRRKDNRLITVDMTGREVLNSGGDVIYLEGFVEDITERTLAEEKLMQSSTRLALAARAGGVGVWDYDNVNNNLIWDDQMYRLYGINQDMFSGVYDAWQAGLHPDDKQRGDNEIQMALLGKKEFDTEFRVVWPDQSIHIIRGLAIVQRDDSGSPLHVIGTNWDITVQKKIEQALRDSEEKLSTLFGSMTEMVVLHELVFNENGDAADYRITDCNQAFTKITGIKREDAIGNLASEVYNTERAPYFEEYSRVAITGVPYDYTTYFEPMDKYFSISVVSPGKNNFATITTDITGIRKVQEVISAKNKELENYLYIASHDLRSPLVNIQGFSRRLQKQTDQIKAVISECSLIPDKKGEIETVIGEGIPDTLNYIYSSVSKMDALLNGLLHVSRTGRTLIAVHEVHMNQLFGKILGNYNYQLTELDAVVEVDNLPNCYGDENLLNQLFSNIIGNAIRYHDRGRKPVIKISAQNEFRRAVYSISDNGTGIEKRHLEKIWDLFYRVDSSQADAGEGLGLSIVKRIAEKHNGKVRVESEPGRGSIFYVELQKNYFEINE